MSTTTIGAPFGTVLAKHMSVARWGGDSWEAPKLGPVKPLALHPAAHVLHYGSACFEGLKAHRGADDVVRIFRLDRHVRRLQASATVLVLPVPTTQLLTEMIIDVVRASLPEVPHSPGSLYLRPMLIGTEENIGAAAHASNEAQLMVLASPVGDYFANGARPLVLAIEEVPRTAPRFGRVKAGANYAIALGPTVRAATDLGADQVLFAPDGHIEETGASNFLLIDPERVITPQLTDSFLHGVTRNSILSVAADLGYHIEERPLRVDEVLAWARRPKAEAALSGTAAVMSGVGELVHHAQRTAVGSGDIGPHTLALRRALTDLHAAKRPDPHGWLTPVLP